MCTQFTTLVESNDFRHILQCEHGTIHLNWDLVTLYLNLSEFEHLAGLLERGIRLAEPSKITESPCMLVYKEHGYYQLWVRNIAINLTPIDFLILVDVVRAALWTVHENQTTEEVAPPTGELSQVFQRTVVASANGLFSLN